MSYLYTFKSNFVTICVYHEREIQSAPAMQLVSGVQLPSGHFPSGHVPGGYVPGGHVPIDVHSAC